MVGVLDDPIASLLERIADERPTPGAGSVAALALAMAASLVEMVARSDGGWDERAGAAAQAACLRARLESLAPQASEAYDAAVEALERPPDGRSRDAELARKLDLAGEVPLRIAEAGADVAELAVLAADQGNPRRRPDAVAAAVLAEAGARVAAHLVAVNLAAAPGDGRVNRVAAAAASAAAAAARAAGGRI